MNKHKFTFGFLFSSLKEEQNNRKKKSTICQYSKGYLIIAELQPCPFADNAYIKRALGLINDRNILIQLHVQGT